jgi:hypothetical protein
MVRTVAEAEGEGRGSGGATQVCFVLAGTGAGVRGWAKETRWNAPRPATAGLAHTVSRQDYESDLVVLADQQREGDSGEGLLAAEQGRQGGSVGGDLLGPGEPPVQQCQGRPRRQGAGFLAVAGEQAVQEGSVWVDELHARLRVETCLTPGKVDGVLEPADLVDHSPGKTLSPGEDPPFREGGDLLDALAPPPADPLEEKVVDRLHGGSGPFPGALVPGDETRAVGDAPRVTGGIRGDHLHVDAEAGQGAAEGDLAPTTPMEPTMLASSARIFVPAQAM